MNYTGRPSISGCRPVLSLYPTHCFCQYLLLIFITFTNSFLFNRAFSTNSRSPLRQRLSLWERSSTSPSRLTPCHCPGCGSQRLLRCRSHPAGRGPNSSSLFPPLAAVVAVAPTEGRLWHSGKLLLFARGSPTRGAVERSETERLYEGKPFLCRKVRLLASPVSFWQIICYNGFAALPAHLFGRGGEKNGKYSFFYTVCRSKCSSLLYLQVA